jgi:sulfur-oxidizing protein SoxZ
MARALINFPAVVKRGDIVEVKTLMSHLMETGFRTGSDGKLVPRDIINRFVCTYSGDVVFSADLFPAISANPFISFTIVARETGTLTFSWVDDGGRAMVQTAPLTIQ